MRATFKSVGPPRPAASLLRRGRGYPGRRAARTARRREHAVPDAHQAAGRDADDEQEEDADDRVERAAEERAAEAQPRHPEVTDVVLDHDERECAEPGA